MSPLSPVPAFDSAAPAPARRSSSLRAEIATILMRFLESVAPGGAQ